MRVHLAPAWGTQEPHPQCSWFRTLWDRSSSGRHTVVDRPNEADVILLTDVGNLLSHVRFRAKLLRLLAHPLVIRYRSRCFIYYELDIPRPYLPGIYLNMEWFPGVERVAAAVAPARGLEPSPNPFFQDDHPPEKRDLLFSFMGRNCHSVRDRLLSTQYDRDDVLLVDTSGLYDHYGGAHDVAMQRQYVHVMRRSRWAICPRGWSASSLRLYEAMRLGIAPVVLNDNWLLPEGPDWERCCLWLPEATYPDLVRILESQGERWLEMGRAAQEAYQRLFSEERAFDHSMSALEALLRRHRDEATVTQVFRQMRELVVHIRGRTTPSLARAQREGVTAVSQGWRPSITWVPERST